MQTNQPSKRPVARNGGVDDEDLARNMFPMGVVRLRSRRPIQMGGIRARFKDLSGVAASGGKADLGLVGSDRTGRLREPMRMYISPYGVIRIY